MESTETDRRAVRHSDDVKERAYQLWAFQASRRAKIVSDLLASGELGDPVDVTERTIRNWATDDGWADRVRRDLRAIAPDMQEQTIAELIMGALSGARYLRAVIEDRAEPNKDKVASSLGAIDRSGLSHIGRSNPADKLVSQSAEQSPDLQIAGKSVADLMSIEAAYRQAKAR